MTETFTARRLPRQPGISGWNAILPPPGPPRSLDQDVTVDFAVIGAGFAGLSAAWRLHQLNPGARIAVMEAGRVGEGPAGRNSGFMIDLPHDLSSEDYAGHGTESDRLQIRLNRLAIGFAREIARACGMSRALFDPCGKINGAATAAGDRLNRNYAEHLRTLGEACELLDAARMRAITGTDYYLSGLYSPGTVMIQPAAYIRRIAESLATDVAVYERSPVQRIAREGALWRLDSTRGSVSAERVILGVNGHAESFGFYRRRLMHIFTYASMTDVLSPAQAAALGGEQTWGITPADPMGATVRRIRSDNGDRIVFRSRFTYDPSMEVSERRLRAVGRMHERRFAMRFPCLAGLSMAHVWAGHLCLSYNGVPAFGEVAENLYSACCQNGLGTVKGTLSGMAAAELASGQRTEAVDALLSFPPPSRLPPEPLAWLGANTYLRFKEWKAGRE